MPKRFPFFTFMTWHQPSWLHPGRPPSRLAASGAEATSALVAPLSVGLPELPLLLGHPVTTRSDARPRRTEVRQVDPRRRCIAAEPNTRSANLRHLPDDGGP